VNVLPASTAPADTKTLALSESIWGYEYRNNGEARYNSLQLEASRKQGWVTFDAHYTLASSLNNVFNTDDVSKPTKSWLWTTDCGETYSPLLRLDPSLWQRAPAHEQCSTLWDALVGGWGVQTISFFGSGDYMTPFFYGF